MTHRLFLVSALCALTLVLGCSKKDPTAGEPAKEAAAEAKAAPEPVMASAISLPDFAPDEPTTETGDVPVSEDLEEEAEQTLHFENLEAELDRLEAEITDA